MAPFEEQDILPLTDQKERSEASFLPALCPYCGWDLDGVKDSAVLTCDNCRHAWEAGEKSFTPVKVFHVRGTSPSTYHLPFWKFQVSASDEQFRTYKDFVRLTGLPHYVSNYNTQGYFSVWLPAFKIRPGIFLRISRHLTISGNSLDLFEGFPDGVMTPVTLPKMEASRAISALITDLSIIKKQILSILPDVKFHFTDYQLVYIPFSRGMNELVQDQLNMSIFVKAFEYGHFI